MFNKDSQKCIDIMEKVNNLIDIDFIQTDQCVFSDQFKIVKKLWNENKLSGESVIINNEEAKNILMQYLDSPFISNKIKKSVKEMKSCNKFKEDGIDVYWYGNSWKKYGEHVLKRLVVTKKLIAPYHPGVVIVIAPTNMKKSIELNEKDNIGIDKVNSGSSLIHHNNISYIFLWREEELEKVAVHEMIHALSCDRELYINNSIDCYIYKWLKIGKNMINVNETFTEVTADILHSMYISCEIGINFYKFLQAERGFSLIQAAKLLKQLGYKSFDQLERNNLNNKEKEFKQKTNTISYYILRAGVMYLFNDYCKMVSSWKTPWIFPKENDNKIKFLNLIIKGCKNMKLDLLIKKINHKTMRFTCIELERS